MTTRPAVLVGSAGGVVIGLFTAYSMLTPLRHDVWDALNTTIYAGFLAGLLVLAIRFARTDLSAREIITELAVASAIYGGAYLFVYWVTTEFFAYRIVQLPFFIRSYTFNRYASPEYYLSADNNYSDLMQLQLISFAVATTIQVAVGTGAAIAWRRWAPRTDTPSA